MDNLYYYAFRYDLIEEQSLDTVLVQLHRLIADAVTVSAGKEFMNKFGDIVKHHIHIHFSSKEKIDCLRKRLTCKKTGIFMRLADDRSRTHYSLGQVTDVLSENLFFRYPWKQSGDGGIILEELQTGLDDVYPGIHDRETHRAMAVDEWRRNRAFHIKKREKQASPNVYDRLEEYLDALELANMDAVVEASLDFYTNSSPKMSINFKTIAGYAIQYGIHTGLYTKSRALEGIKKFIE